jgi:predicted amidohydrolase
MTEPTAATIVKILRLAVKGTRGFTTCTDLSIPECVVLVAELVASPAADCLVSLVAWRGVLASFSLALRPVPYQSHLGPHLDCSTH